MINTKFINFKNELLLESVLEAEPNFLDVLKNMTPLKYRDIILQWIHYKKDDVTTKYNLLSPSEIEADKILYFQDGQFQRFKQTSSNLHSRPKSDRILKSGYLMTPGLGCIKDQIGYQKNIPNLVKYITNI